MADGRPPGQKGGVATDSRAFTVDDAVGEGATADARTRLASLPLAPRAATGDHPVALAVALGTLAALSLAVLGAESHLAFLVSGGFVAGLVRGGSPGAGAVAGAYAAIPALAVAVAVLAARGSPPELGVAFALVVVFGSPLFALVGAVPGAAGGGLRVRFNRWAAVLQRDGRRDGRG